MKSYTVKKIMKLDQKYEELNDFQNKELDDFCVLPLTLLTCIGIGIGSTTITGEIASVAPLIMGSAMVLLGAAGLVNIFTMDFQKNKIWQKIEKSFDVMGEDFKQQVYAEMRKQKLGR